MQADAWGPLFGVYRHKKRKISIRRPELKAAITASAAAAVAVAAAAATAAA